MKNIIDQILNRAVRPDDNEMKILDIISDSWNNIIEIFIEKTFSVLHSTQYFILTDSSNTSMIIENVFLFTVDILINFSVASQSSSYNEPAEGFTFEKRTIEYYTPLKVRLIYSCNFLQSLAKFFLNLLSTFIHLIFVFNETRWWK